ncbi:hypothetical protein ACFW4O_13550 [Streptomyces mutabilis]|uniref:hypothetical protein n=1 Tax=Streptomyces mutabilis TaxID=67332 RepID=UPI00369E8B95
MGTEDEEDKTETACRICGYDDGEPVFNEYGVPQYVICPCCYNESGIGATGAQWHDPKLRPANWDLMEQLANIPPQWC